MEHRSKLFLSSVPQGTCLGPLLFLIYVNELPEVVKNGSVYLFADDCKIQFIFNRDSYPDCLQQDLNIIKKWSDSMQLSLSPDKCAILQLGNRTDNLARKYYIGEKELQNCTSMRDLGIIIDSKLNFSEHCSTIVKKAAMRMNIIFRSFETRETGFLLDMFKTFVRPILEYATTCWSPYLAKDIKLIESVQRKFTRRIPAISHLNLPYLDRLNVLNLERLDLRRLKTDLVMVYRLFNDHVDIDVSKILTPHHQAYASYKGIQIASTKLRLTKSPVKHLCRQNYFGLRVVNPWNLLPEQVRLAKNISVFKKCINRAPNDLGGLNLVSLIRRID